MNSDETDLPGASIGINGPINHRSRLNLMPVGRRTPTGSAAGARAPSGRAAKVRYPSGRAARVRAPSGRAARVGALAANALRGQCQAAHLEQSRLRTWFRARAWRFTCARCVGR